PSGPNGNLFVVSLSHGTVYEIFRAQPSRGRGPEGAASSPAPAAASQAGLHFVTHLTGSEEVPARETRAQGQAIFHLSKDGTQLTFRLIGANISNLGAAHIHPGPAGANAGADVSPSRPP